MFADLFFSSRSVLVCLHMFYVCVHGALQAFINQVSLSLRVYVSEYFFLHVLFCGWVSLLSPCVVFLVRSIQTGKY